MGRATPRPLSVVITLFLLAGIWSARYLAPGPGGRPGVAPDFGASREDTPAGRDDGRIRRAFEARTSGILVEVQGIVARRLSDDRDGSRHQRFILELSDGLSLLVTHNIDLAPRVPLETGERVVVRGQYEWNAEGGVVHWTHHDPAGLHEPGWIQHLGTRYE